jgi:3-phenylpropionate/trans-cinnamate dioxygenase ferredoxin component
MSETRVCATEDLPEGTVTGSGKYAVGNAKGDYFAVTRRCRHLYADLANGSIDRDGCLVCPWHGSRYDVGTGRMVRGPQGIFAKIPGLDQMFMALTRVLPLGRGKVSERSGSIFVE